MFRENLLFPSMNETRIYYLIVKKKYLMNIYIIDQINKDESSHVINQVDALDVYMT